MMYTKDLQKEGLFFVLIPDFLRLNRFVLALSNDYL